MQRQAETEAKTPGSAEPALLHPQPSADNCWTPASAREWITGWQRSFTQAGLPLPLAELFITPLGQIIIIQRMDAPPEERWGIVGPDVNHPAESTGTKATILAELACRLHLAFRPEWALRLSAPNTTPIPIIWQEGYAKCGRCGAVWADGPHAMACWMSHPPEQEQDYEATRSMEADCQAATAADGEAPAQATMDYGDGPDQAPDDEEQEGPSGLGGDYPDEGVLSVPDDGLRGSSPGKVQFED